MLIKEIIDLFVCFDKLEICLQREALLVLKISQPLLNKVLKYSWIWKTKFAKSKHTTDKIFSRKRKQNGQNVDVEECYDGINNLEI